MMKRLRAIRNNHKLSAVFMLSLSFLVAETFDHGSRKILQPDYDGHDKNRIGAGCSQEDIAISQEATPPLPNGIPTYTADIMNENTSGCSISDIHVSCRWFGAARMVNPRIFKRLDYDDCLVNDGEPLSPGQILSFEYATTFPYPLSVSSVSCCS